MNKKLLNCVFVGELILFGLIVTGVLSRSVVPYLAIALAVYALLVSLEDATVFFVRSIPFFLAIPVTATFDNFNTWRILAVIIFLRWLWQIPDLKSYIKNSHRSRLSFVLHGLIVLAILSIIPAPEKILAVKRIIYFVNLSLIGFVIYDLAQKQDSMFGSSTSKHGFFTKLIKNIAIPTITVTIVGFIQLGSTYLMDIYQFMDFWAGKVQFNQFGAGWSYIVYNLGNTWYAYYGEQISLRMFSLFPDSHSFPQFILLGLPTIFALFFKTDASVDSPTSWRRGKKKILTVLVSSIFLAAILTGTRGIWAAGAVSSLMALFLVFWFKKTKLNQTTNVHRIMQMHNSVYISNQLVFRQISLSLVIFSALFIVAFPIFASPQFRLYKMDPGLLAKRVSSIINFGETSNKERIRIWKLSLESIKNHPLLGVGIGNFPVVLNQNLSLAKAGSSAHNIYLHIAAEMGILALIFTLWFLWLLLQKVYENFTASRDWEIIIYNGAALIFVPWVLIYSLTDVALFDERAFLMFVATISLILANKNPD